MAVELPTKTLDMPDSSGGMSQIDAWGVLVDHVHHLVINFLRWQNTTEHQGAGEVTSVAWVSNLETSTESIQGKSTTFDNVLKQLDGNNEVQLNESMVDSEPESLSLSEINYEVNSFSINE